jgi:hypothetical protein
MRKGVGQNSSPEDIVPGKNSRLHIQVPRTLHEREQLPPIHPGEILQERGRLDRIRRRPADGTSHPKRPRPFEWKKIKWRPLSTG